MPKELVRASDQPYGGRWVKPDGTEEDLYVPVDSVVEVRWDRESGYFQMATKAIDVTTGGPVLDYPAALRSAFGPTTDEPMTDKATEAEIAAAAARYEANWVAQQQGHYIQLDRKGINDLIRTLRRARNAAFGADE